MKHNGVGYAPILLLGFFPLAFGGMYAWVSNPVADPQALPAGLIGLETPEGQALLADSESRADADVLLRQLQPQEKLSWCGVASSATVLTGLTGKHVSQDSVFNDRASAVRSFWSVTFGGMPLDVLAGILAAHDVNVVTVHANESNAGAFREVVERNLAERTDFLIVNYSRKGLGQGDGGHISPVGAYDEDTDRVLILDTNSHKWPPTWVTVDSLFKAMNTTDSDGGRARGWVEVSR